MADSRFSQRWRGDGGYRHVLSIAVPLILSMGMMSIQHFVDRMFLTWLSPEAIAAAMPAGTINFTVMSFFLGIAIFSSTFVAQYNGANRPERIGPAVWQGAYVGLLAGVLHLVLRGLAGDIFGFIGQGHPPLQRAAEIDYFRGLCLGTGQAVAAAAFASFFTGRGRPWPVMWVNLAGTVVNIVANYALIFGHFGLPRWGAYGAGLGTSISATSTFVIYLGLFALPRFRQRFRTLAGWRPDPEILRRLLRFGLPAGVHFFLEMIGFTVFIQLVGGLGVAESAATGIAFNINMLAFMPVIGLGQAVSVVVGQAIGGGRPETGARGTWSALHLGLAYTALCSLVYLAGPEYFLLPFAAGQRDPAAFAEIQRIAMILLRYVAAYCVLDAVCIVFAAALKGAGDTRFVMLIIIAVSLSLLVAPSVLILYVFEGGLFLAWLAVPGYIGVLGLVFWLRFRQGRWREMKVIEEAPPVPPLGVPLYPDGADDSIYLPPG